MPSQPLKSLRNDFNVMPVTKAICEPLAVTVTFAPLESVAAPELSVARAVRL